MLQGFLNKLSSKGKLFFYLMVVVLTIAIIDRLFIGPVNNHINKLSNEIEQQKNIVNQDYDLLSRKDEIERKMKTFKQYFTKAVEDEDVVTAGFLEKVESLATQSQVNLVKSNPSDSKKEENYSQYSVNLDCMGDLKNVVEFMHLINSTDELLKISQFNMTPKRGSKTEVNASMTVTKLIVNPNNP